MGEEDKNCTPSATPAILVCLSVFHPFLKPYPVPFYFKKNAGFIDLLSF